METLRSLIQIRKDRKIDQKSVARHLNINRVTMSRYEQGIREIPFYLAEKYAEYLGYEIRLLKK